MQVLHFGGCRRSSRLTLDAFLVLAVFLTAPLRADFCPDTGTVLSTSDTGVGDAPFAVRWCDLDGDGDADLITANDASDTISVLLNNGDGTYAPKVRWPVDADIKAISEPVDVACCDVNGDTHIDLISVNHTSDDVSVLLNNGSNQFPTSVKYTVGEAPFGVECLNLDGANGSDIVTNGFTEDAISVLLNNGDGTFAPHVTYATGNAPIAMTLCDVAGEAHLDIVTANMLDKSVTVMENNGDGTFTNIGSAEICRAPLDCINPFDITCCDFDGVDGPDIATSNGLDNSVAVLFNDGSGGLVNLQLYDGTNDDINVEGAYGITCCDLDGDTRADVISANLTSDDLAVFFNEGLGALGKPTYIQVGVDSTANPSSVVCINTDGDGDIDLTTGFADGLTIFENDCSGCGNFVCDPPENPCTCSTDCDPDESPGPEQSCADGVDNDCDGMIDCDDFDCCGDANCCTAAESACGDGCDEDCDGCPDGLDADCGATESSCADGVDNDCDGFVDCTDTDCPECPCQPPVVTAVGPRYVSVTPALGQDQVAIWVEGVDPDVVCVAGHLDATGLLAGFATYQPPGANGWETVYAHGLEMSGGMTFSFQADCDPAQPGTELSDPALATLWQSGDVDNNFVVDIRDAVKGVDGFSGRYLIVAADGEPCSDDTDCAERLPHQSCHLASGLCVWVTLENVDTVGDTTCEPNGVVSIIDIVDTLKHFQGFPDVCNPQCP